MEFDDAALRATVAEAGDDVPALCARWMAEYLDAVDEMAQEASED